MYHSFICLMDLALTYASRKPRLARSLAADALVVSLMMGRPDLTYRANTLLGVL